MTALGAGTLAGRPCPDRLVALAEHLAEAAAAVVRRHFRTPITVDDKPDRSPVTLADREAEAVMRRLIAEAHPEHGIVGEEYGSERPEASHVWVLDPIDGTKRFITGNPLFGTLIALLEDGRPILGVIDMPMLGERWIGAAGRATLFRDRNGERPAQVRSCPGLAKATLSATSPQMFDDEEFAAFERVRRAAKMTLYGGDCFSYGLVASGFLDLVIEADMSAHDYLALVPVVSGAGGRMADWTGAPLTLASDGRTLAAGDPRLFEAALALLQNR